MSQPARRHAGVDPHIESATGTAVSRAKKVPVFLVTLDETLWPHIGQKLDSDCVLKQVDSIEELQRTSRAGQSGVVIWDARDLQDREGELSRLQRHSARLAIIVLDAAERTEAWKSARRQHQIVSMLGVPFDADELLERLLSAREECLARSAILGEVGASAAAEAATPSPRKPPWIALSIAAAFMVCGAAYLIYRHRAAPSSAAPTPSAAGHAAAAHPAAPPAAPPAALPATAPAPADAASADDEQIDTLLEKARQAMRDRHFIDPASENALTLYRGVLAYDPSNGEARQGLERLAQILIARVQSDLDERKFDLALQALETARSLSPDDPRLAELDARIATLRSEFGPAQIQAVINAKNFDRALQLIEEAGRAKSLSGARLNQLREEVRRREAEADAEGVLKLLGMRIQQNRLLEPQYDSAVYYLKQARLAGASAADLAQPTEELTRKLTLAARAALDGHRLDDAQRLLDEAKKMGGPPKLLAGMRSELGAARDAQARDKKIRSQALDLAQARLAQGEILEPANDSAFYYVNQLRAVDPANAQLPQISAALGSAVLARARAAHYAGDDATADSMLKAASTLIGSAELGALRDALAREEAGQGARDAGKPAEVAANTLVPVKPVKLQYPRGALSDGTEGWVDLAFNVTREGKVTNVTVMNSSPHNVFDAAAKGALSRARYQPVVLDGQAVEVTSKLHVVFRLAQP